jgi:PTH1 family peptidyl-tRNA hydrolase
MQNVLDSIKLIVGLGNTGSEYAKTRHNAGFMFVDEFHRRLLSDLNWKHQSDFKADIIKSAGDEFIIAKPTTMMNLSGEAVRAIMDFYKLKPDDVLVAHDDMDIALGEYKIQFGKGPKVHNGLASIEQHLSTENFWRLRLGIENREVKGNKGIPGMTYALQRFQESELTLLHKAIDDVFVTILS